MKNPRMPRPSLKKEWYSPPRAAIGHNSVQVPHDGHYVPSRKGFCPEEDWRRFEREQARRERFRLIRKGIIIPSFKAPPQMMVKVSAPDGTEGDGVWKPEIKLCQP